MLSIDFKAHNERSKEIWKAYEQKKPSRVPVVIYADARNWLHEPEENIDNITMCDYIKDPELMLECQVRSTEWIRHNILSDCGMGYPEDGWSVRVDFQNFLEPVWLGGEVKYGKEPHTEPFLNDDNKWSVLDKGIPEPFGGINAEVIKYYEYFQGKKGTFTYKGIPLSYIDMPFNMTGTDGPFTNACSIRGTENFIMDILEDPEYAHQLLDYITTASVERIKETRKYLGVDDKDIGFGFADDSIVLLSLDMFKEFVLPYHKKLFNALSSGSGGRSMHLCGDAQRFFAVLSGELNVKSFDTGFPLNFETLYDELSSEVTILGGPSIKLIRYGTDEEVKNEAKRILQSGVMEKSKAFILREGNALAPGTPIKNVNMIYKAAEEYGCYKS